jgi:hypothetical protein
MVTVIFKVETSIRFNDFKPFKVRYPMRTGTERICTYSNCDMELRDDEEKFCPEHEGTIKALRTKKGFWAAVDTGVLAVGPLQALVY